MMTDGDYSRGEHDVRFRGVEPLCCTAGTNVTLCINYTQIKEKNHMRRSGKTLIGNIVSSNHLLQYKIFYFIFNGFIEVFFVYKEHT